MTRRGTDQDDDTGEMGERAEIYRGYTQEELDAQYEQRTLIADLSVYMAYWEEASETARNMLECRLDVPYGPGPSEQLDVFPARAAGAPVLVYLHGGAWRLLSKASSAYVAPILAAAGACVVVPDFDPATAVSLDEMVRQVRATVTWTHANADSFNGDRSRVFIAGHSSGAHLAAMGLASGWRQDFGLPENAIKGAILASGAYDLEPVRLCKRNTYLCLSETAAHRNSPIHHIPRPGPEIVVAWGHGELNEFRRQGAAFAEAWRAAGNGCESLVLDGYNHFDVANAFGDAEGPIVALALRLMGLA